MSSTISLFSPRKSRRLAKVGTPSAPSNPDASLRRTSGRCQPLRPAHRARGQAPGTPFPSQPAVPAARAWGAGGCRGRSRRGSARRRGCGARRARQGLPAVRRGRASDCSGPGRGRCAESPGSSLGAAAERALPASGAGAARPRCRGATSQNAHWPNWGFGSPGRNCERTGEARLSGAAPWYFAVLGFFIVTLATTQLVSGREGREGPEPPDCVQRGGAAEWAHRRPRGAPLGRTRRGPRTPSPGGRASAPGRGSNSGPERPPPSADGDDACLGLRPSGSVLEMRSRPRQRGAELASPTLGRLRGPA